MAYGFAIAVGESPVRLADNLHQLIAEVRVEQDMSRPTKFAVRFEDDICKGDRIALTSSAIKAGQKLSVMVPGKDNALKCLVKGQVTKIKSSAVTGGPGSWLEVHGEDLRAELGREAITATWTGTASHIASSVFGMHGIKADVKSCDTPVFGSAKGQRTHNQSGTDLQLLENLARMLGYEFWFNYTVKAAVGGAYSILPEAKFKPSPDYPTGGGGVTIPAPPIDLLGDKKVKTLRLDTASNCCRNITSFQLDVDVEKATLAMIHALDDQTGRSERDEAKDERPPADPQTSKVLKDFGCTRKIIIPEAGPVADQASANRSTIAEEGWYIKARASTSAHLMDGDIVEAHDIVAVEGHGFAHSGRYHVAKVVHVVNAWGHLMDLSLRRNALPSTAYA